MNRRALLGSGAACLLAAPALAQQDPLQIRLEELRASAGIPALGGAIVTADGLAWSGVTGVRRRGDADAVTLDERWHLGSNTKVMTAALYARLVEQGRAEWGASLADLFPQMSPDPAWAAVTVEQLMGHRAGILDSAVMPAWMLVAWAANDVRETRRQLAQTVLSAPPAGALGAYSYANANYIILGAVIEQMTGSSWEDVIQAELFRPLGMDPVGFGAPQGENAWGHQGPAMTPKAPTVMGSDNPPGLGPAGTVHASLEAYARFIRLFLTDGAGVLSGDSITRLSTPVEGPGQSYALGWGVLNGPPWAGGGPVLTHDGSNTLWLARAVVAPGRGAAAICVANAADPARPAIDGLTRALIERFPDTQ